VSTGELRWDGRVAVITGAGRNLGRAYALLLASRGASVVVNDLGVAISDTDGSGDAPAENPAAAVVAEIESSGGTAAMSTDSVTTVEGGEAIIATALDAFGRVDVLINNAGVVRQAEFADYVPELLDPVIASQIGGHFNVTRPAWRTMRAAGYGRILNLSSGAGLWGVAGMAGYSAAKMAIVGLTRALALEGAPFGIAVNAMAPSAKTRPGGFGPIPASDGLHDWLSVDVVAPVAAWLVHEDCDASGETFSVGGAYAGRVSVAVNDGHRWDRPMTPESVRDAWSDVMSDASWHPLPAGGGDVVRMLEGFKG
jgi:NAD(P)-dependent dehydrogenase (short-subunit alcohol dehydrogenase family)